VLAREQGRLDSALARLSPSERALLELSLIRKVPDEDIASLLQVAANDVGRRRDQTLARVAEAVDVGSKEELLTLLTLAWHGPPAQGSETAAAPGADAAQGNGADAGRGNGSETTRELTPAPAREGAEAAPQEAEAAEQDAKEAALTGDHGLQRFASKTGADAPGRFAGPLAAARERLAGAERISLPPRRTAILAAALAAVVIVAVALSRVGGGEPEKGGGTPAGQEPQLGAQPGKAGPKAPTPPAHETPGQAAPSPAGGKPKPKKPPAKPKPAPAKPKAAPAPALTLGHVPGSPGASGAARITGSGAQARLDLDIKGLRKPSGSYVVWLYDSVAQSRKLASFGGSSANVDVLLPEGFRRYRFVDVSLEPADGNPNHSGQSLLRVPISRLLP
jgi:hypothetical protein